jgi:hypothetical protein
VLGSPGKVGQLSAEEIARTNAIADHYVNQLPSAYQAGLEAQT